MAPVRRESAEANNRSDLTDAAYGQKHGLICDPDAVPTSRREAPLRHQGALPRLERWRGLRRREAVCHRSAVGRRPLVERAFERVAFRSRPVLFWKSALGWPERDEPRGEGNCDQCDCRDNEVGHPRPVPVKDSCLLLQNSQNGQQQKKPANADQEETNETKARVSSHGLEGIDRILPDVLRQNGLELIDIVSKRGPDKA